jgi:hypothetical protein
MTSASFYPELTVAIYVSVRVLVPTLDEVRSSSVPRLAAMVPVMPQVSVYIWIHEGNIEEENNGYVVF